MRTAIALLAATALASAKAVQKRTYDTYGEEYIYGGDSSSEAPPSTGTYAPLYPVSSGTGITYPHPTGSSAPPYPVPSGSSYTYPHGSVTPSGSGTGSVTYSATTETATYPHETTYTVSTGTGSTTYTSTHYGTTTEVNTVTKFVPCSTPIATSAGSTYYSSYLTASSYTTTNTITTTAYAVVCPTAAPAHETTPGSESYTHGPESGPAHTALPPKTLYGSASGTCPPEKTVYSTLVATSTYTVTEGAAAPTHCPKCETYTFSLPNGQTYTTTIAPSTHPVAKTTETVAPYPIPGKPTSYPYHPSGTGSVKPLPTASGSNVYPGPSQSTGTAVPTEYFPGGYKAYY